MDVSTDRQFGFIPPARWMSIYNLARCMDREVRWVRRHFRDRGQVPHTKIGDTEFFYTDDVIRFLEDAKNDPSEGLGD